MAVFKNLPRPGLLMLNPFYGLAVQLRNLLFDLRILRSTRFKLPVISVGNITVGGTGKTPHVEYLIRILKDDHQLAILSRGYKRKTNHYVLASHKTGIKDIGDEPVQMKRKFPDVQVAVDRKRVHGIRTLIDTVKNLDVIILDDAYQHRYVVPGLSIVLIDFNRPVFSDMLLPAGNLREPGRNLNRADIILVTKCPESLSPYIRESFIQKLHLNSNQQVFFTKYAYGSPLQIFQNKRSKQNVLSYKALHKSGASVLLVTGIANPAPLRLFLSNMVAVKKEIQFSDHHNFSFEDIQNIRNAFESIEGKEKYIFVTEKDAVRMQETMIMDKSFRRLLYYIPIEVKFLAKGEKPFIKKMNKYLKRATNK